MTKAASPRSVSSGACHHRSVRSVRCGIWARLGEKTPVARRSAVGALTVPFRRVQLLCEASMPAVSSLAADAAIADVAPELPVVLGVGDRDLLAAGLLLRDAVAHREFFRVDVEPVDVEEDAFGVIGYAAGSRRVTVLGRQCCDATTHLADQLVQF